MKLLQSDPFVPKATKTILPFTNLSNFNLGSRALGQLQRLGKDVRIYMQLRWRLFQKKSFFSTLANSTVSNTTASGAVGLKCLLPIGDVNRHYQKAQCVQFTHIIYLLTFTHQISRRQSPVLSCSRLSRPQRAWSICFVG